MRTRRALSLALGLGLLLGAGACSDDHEHQGGMQPRTACEADARKDTYAPGLSKAAGELNVRLVESRPGPPTKGTNVLVLEVLDASGKPVEGATVTVTPWMPDHAHGSPAKAVVTPAGGGRYTVENVVLSMAGLWQLKVGVQPSGGAPPVEAVFQLCLDG